MNLIQGAVHEALRDAGLEEYQSEYRTLLRRDWVVRVLNAWAATGRAYTMTPPDAREPWGVVTDGNPHDDIHFGATPDAALHAAAQAVYPELPADVRAELGECP